MHDMIEGFAICLSVVMIFTPVIGFLLFLRYIRRKEKAALEQIEQ
ncbi:MAG: hypothetical protein R3293_28130 [Candidatus Promineifilaceae bacterium]|nr:hypothetical protein [Candidatus Promineifilaceae bacterium]